MIVHTLERCSSRASRPCSSVTCSWSLLLISSLCCNCSWTDTSCSSYKNYVWYQQIKSRVPTVYAYTPCYSAEYVMSWCLLIISITFLYYHQVTSRHIFKIHLHLSSLQFTILKCEIIIILYTYCSLIDDLI